MLFILLREWKQLEKNSASSHNQTYILSCIWTHTLSTAMLQTPRSILHTAVYVNSTFWNTFQQHCLLGVSTFSHHRLSLISLHSGVCSSYESFSSFSRLLPYQCLLFSVFILLNPSFLIFLHWLIFLSPFLKPPSLPQCTRWLIFISQIYHLLVSFLAGPCLFPHG